MFHKILVAIDNSKIARHVFEEALLLANANAACLMLLNVISPFDDQYFNPVFLQPVNVYPTCRAETLTKCLQQWEELKQNKINFLTSLHNEAIAAGVTVEFTQNFGVPSRMICDVARSWEADLIVMGHRSLTGLSEFFLGSVSNYVLHHATCSVLIVDGFSKNVEIVEKKQATAA